MALSAMEERVAALEEKVEMLFQQQEMPWWKQIVGVFENDPAFEEAMRLGREWRESEDAFQEEDVAA